MTKNILRFALAAAMLTTGAVQARAETSTGPTKSAVEVRIINNYVSPVRVYVRDAKGHDHELGWVGRADLKILRVSEDIAQLGAFEIKVFPDEPVWSRLSDDKGVRTNGLQVADGEALNFWVEANMAASTLEVVRG